MSTDAIDMDAIDEAFVELESRIREIEHREQGGDYRVAVDFLRSKFARLADALEAARADGESGWLIERNDLGAPQWLQFGPSYGETNYWPDADKALRFARQCDAERFIAMHEASDPALRATEHVWLRNRTPSPPARAGEWLPIESAPEEWRDGRRLLLGWKYDNPALAPHFELGWFSGAAWRNTYGHPFSGDPDFLLRPRPLPSPPAEEKKT